MTRVAVMIDGVVTVHMDGDASYDTLCGLDSNDPDIGLEPADVPRNGRARIDCPDCWRLWNSCRLFAAKDFSDAVKKPG